ncbi:MAG TPA: alternative ribosome rescue aminoacyl-tRNA hydrolase ArfB [Longimicrobiaceae bacterium]|nr:alternative ribosome rescue aminoacyl-tRNA hydrolase ArfB [Longimicrobiaceae bacterium]
MNDAAILAVTDDLFIPRSELAYRASRSGGPGGQHVNTSSTRVELVWDVAGSPSLTDAQRARILEKLSNRINSAGELLLAGSESRSQHQNREAVTERFVELLRGALHRPPRRKKTKPTRASRERRLQAKKRRSEVKRLRGRVPPD